MTGGGQVVRLPHACEEMAMFVEDSRVPVEYDAQDRSYVIRLYVPDREPGPDQRIVPGPRQQIEFCPWCGAKLPSSLWGVLCDEIEELVGEDYEDISEELAKAPSRYQSDEWWQGHFDWDGNRIKP